MHTTTTAMLGALALATGAQAGSLMDQVGANDGTDIDTSNILASQYFEAAYSIYSIAAIDDFDNSGGMSATSVAAVVSGWNGYTSIDMISGVQVNFYVAIEDAAANLVGYASADGSVNLDANWTGQAYGDLVYLDGNWALTTDTQMVTLIPVNEFAVNGQTGVATSFIGDASAWQANPGGGFGMPSNWQAATANLSIRVMGGVGDPCDQPLGPCPADVTGDGPVNVNDILAVIGSYGEIGDGTYRPIGDCDPAPNGDCAVTVDDLLLVIGAFGDDCTPMGACCFGLAGCDENVAEGDCSGDWLGNGSTCNDCHAGACCYSDGTCTESSPDECAAAGGTYSGDGIDCVAAACPQPSPGACCIGFTDCIDDLMESDCQAFGGIFQGSDTDCATNSCGWGGCPADATDEGVPCQEDSNGLPNDPNGGLNNNPVQYGAIAVDETICGLMSTFTCIGCGDAGEDLTYRDTDWYLFDASAGGVFTVKGGGESNLLFGIVDLDAVAFVGNFVTEPYQEGEVTLTLPAGGNYCVWVGYDFNSGLTIPCSSGSNDYSVTLLGEAAPAAACCVAGSCVGDLNPADCDALGGTYVTGESCATYACPTNYEGCTDGTVSESDFACVCFVDGDDAETDCNGGTNMLSPTFTPVSVGDIICGELSVYVEGPTGGTYRDLDWWTSTEVNAGGTFDLSIGSQMGTVILLVNLDAGTVDNDVAALPGTIASATWTIGGGNWSVVTAPSEWNTAWTCASGMSEYRFTLE